MRKSWTLFQAVVRSSSISTTTASATTTATTTTTSTAGSIPKTGQNLIEKIVQKYAVDLLPGQRIRSGDFVGIQPEHVMTHDNTAAVMSKWVSSVRVMCLNTLDLYLSLSPPRFYLSLSPALLVDVTRDCSISAPRPRPPPLLRYPPPRVLPLPALCLFLHPAYFPSSPAPPPPPATLLYFHRSSGSRALERHPSSTSASPFSLSITTSRISRTRYSSI